MEILNLSKVEVYRSSIRINNTQQKTTMGKRAAPAPAPAGKKITFGSDDELEDAPIITPTAQPTYADDSDEDDSDDDAPEMIGASGAKAAEQRRLAEAEA